MDEKMFAKIFLNSIYRKASTLDGEPSGHKFKLIDIVEQYEVDEVEQMNFNEHIYVIMCVGCGERREIREDTYYKMMEHGVLYSGD